MDRKILKSRAKENLFNNKDLYLYTFLYFVIVFISSFIVNLIPVLGSLAYMVIVILLSSLIYKISLDVSYGKNISFEFNNLGRFIKTYLWYLLYSLPAFIPMFIAMFAFSIITFIGISASLAVDRFIMEYRDLITLFLILLFFIMFILSIVISVYVSLNYSLSLYIASEEDNLDLTAKECIDLTKKLIYGHRTEFLKLQLSFIPWILLTTITCGLAGIYVIPYQQLTITQFYLELKNNN